MPTDPVQPNAENAQRPYGPAVFHAPKTFDEADLFSLGNDISAQHIRRQHRRSVTDPLTGAKNRYGIEEYFGRVAFRQSLSNPPAQTVGVMAIDLIGLKYFNDAFVPQQSMGDNVLKAMATALTRSLDNLGWKGVELFRPGGDEMLLIGNRAFDQEDRLRLAAELDKELRIELQQYEPQLSLDRNAVGFRYGTASVEYTDQMRPYKMGPLLDQQLRTADSMTSAAKFHAKDRRSMEGRPVELDLRSGLSASYGEMIVGDEHNLVRDPREKTVAEVEAMTPAQQWDAAIADANGRMASTDLAITGRAATQSLV